MRSDGYKVVQHLPLLFIEQSVRAANFGRLTLSNKTLWNNLIVLEENRAKTAVIFHATILSYSVLKPLITSKNAQ